MKAFILSVMTLTLLYSAHQADSNKPQFEKIVAGVYQVSALDILDPSWPKLA